DQALALAGPSLPPDLTQVRARRRGGDRLAPHHRRRSDSRAGRARHRRAAPTLPLSLPARREPAQPARRGTARHRGARRTPALLAGAQARTLRRRRDRARARPAPVPERLTGGRDRLVDLLRPALRRGHGRVPGRAPGPRIRGPAVPRPLRRDRLGASRPRRRAPAGAALGGRSPRHRDRARLCRANRRGRSPRRPAGLPAGARAARRRRPRARRDAAVRVRAERDHLRRERGRRPLRHARDPGRAAADRPAAGRPPRGRPRGTGSGHLLLLRQPRRRRVGCARCRGTRGAARRGQGRRRGRRRARRLLPRRLRALRLRHRRRDRHHRGHLPRQYRSSATLLVLPLRLAGGLAGGHGHPPRALLAAGHRRPRGGGGGPGGGRGDRCGRRLHQGRDRTDLALLRATGVRGRGGGPAPATADARAEPARGAGVPHAAPARNRLV
ncbi:MAG: hypothetical protein AVDCRST_MAG17-160, partial [uncultured Solirubrobacterales bacterium]